MITVEQKSITNTFFKERSCVLVFQTPANYCIKIIESNLSISYLKFINVIISFKSFLKIRVIVYNTIKIFVAIIHYRVDLVHMNCKG